MNSHITPGFRKLLAALPEDVRRQARSAYREFMADPRHPGLRLKQIHGSDRLVSVRISREYRAVGVQTIGSKQGGKLPDSVLFVARGLTLSSPQIEPSFQGQSTERIEVKGVL